MDVQVSVRLDPALRESLRRVVEQEGVTMQAYVTNALRDALARSAQEHRDKLDTARMRLAEVLDSGMYTDYVKSIADPDLRTE